MKSVLYFVTGNANKIKEVSSILPENLILKGLKDFQVSEDIPETSGTIRGNALQKARYIFDKFGVDCFADDSGLMIDSLQGAPGVDSAHYAGPNRDTKANIDLVLKNLEGIEHRGARFQTIIALILEGKEYFFDGVVEGDILLERRGASGFGYDPIFQPKGYTCSFSELDLKDKNAISHRGQAIKKLVDFLEGKGFFDKLEG